MPRACPPWRPAQPSIRARQSLLRPNPFKHAPAAVGDSRPRKFSLIGQNQSLPSGRPQARIPSSSRPPGRSPRLARRTTAPRGGQRALLKARPVKAGLPLRAAKPRFATRDFGAVRPPSSKLKRSRNRNAPTLPGPARPGPTRLAHLRQTLPRRRRTLRAAFTTSSGKPRAWRRTAEQQIRLTACLRPTHGATRSGSGYRPSPGGKRSFDAPSTAPVSHARPVPHPRRSASGSRFPNTKKFAGSSFSTEPVLAARVQGARVQAANGRPAQVESPRPVTAAPTNPPPASAPSLVPAVPPSPPIGASLVANARWAPRKEAYISAILVALCCGAAQFQVAGQLAGWCDKNSQFSIA